jgi:hypothetical protein
MPQSGSGKITLRTEYMNLTQLMSIVVASQKKDWNHITCWGYGSGPSYRDHLTFYEKDYKVIQMFCA